MDAYVEVTKPDGTTERFPIEGAQVTLGKSGTAGISLPTAHDLELEHLLIAPRGKEGCWVSTSQGAATPTQLRGKSFTNGMVPWNTDLVIGRIKVRVTNKKPKTRGSGEGPSKIVIIGGGLAVALGAWTFLSGDEGLMPSAEGIQPPPLFASLDESCPAGVASEEDAARVEYRGHVRGDRYRYDARDGVAAVELYRQATACYTQVGESTRAGEARATGETLAAEIDADYASRRLRLHHALEVSDWRGAIREAEELSRLTAHLVDDPYREWLVRTLRIARARDRASRAKQPG